MGGEPILESIGRVLAVWKPCTNSIQHSESDTAVYLQQALVDSTAERRQKHEALMGTSAEASATSR